jgi:hypothetical protein
MLAGWIAETTCTEICDYRLFAPGAGAGAGAEMRSQEAARSDYLPTNQELPPMRPPVFPPIPANSEIARSPTGSPLRFVG